MNETPIAAIIVGGVMTGIPACGAIVRMKLRPGDMPSAFAAVTETLYAPARVGVPLTTPELLMVNPAGNA